MIYEVSLTKDAERDLEEIYFYIAEHDSAASANHVLERLIRATDALKTNTPFRSSRWSRTHKALTQAPI
jgi:toxin ParE1/3/4